jgi:predicted RNase H-like HicB family nuclease
MKSYVFKLVIEADQFEDGTPAFHASCPALKGCHSWGHTYQEALANIQEAVELYVEDLREAGESIPTSPETAVMEFSTPTVAVNV